MNDKTKHIEICRKGGLAVSQNSEYMSTIGRIGGLKSAQVRRKKKLEREQEL